RNTSARNPSHLGSNIHPSPWGNASARFESIGRRGGRTGSSTRAVYANEIAYCVPMRIATWNVNSLKARLDKGLWWLERASPDVLLMQETKLSDEAAANGPGVALAHVGYELAHHGEGRWNGVAIASRCGVSDIVTNFGAPLRSDPSHPDSSAAVG